MGTCGWRTVLLRGSLGQRRLSGATRLIEDERPFRREFEGLQRFERISREHPSQLALFHIGRNDAEGYFYYIMELADGVGRESVMEYRSIGVMGNSPNRTVPGQSWQLSQVWDEAGS